MGNPTPCQGVKGLAYVQNMLNLRDPGTDAEVRAFCRDQGVRYIPYSPLAAALCGMHLNP
jgi:aryl-alcohol dehydrogenase-like predicted oxidoreductase